MSVDGEERYGIYKEGVSETLQVDQGRQSNRQDFIPLSNILLLILVLKDIFLGEIRAANEQT